MVEIKMTQEEFEILDRILSGLLHGTERLAVIAAIDKEGFSRRPEPLVRGMEIDIEAFAKEMFDICTFPEPTPWDGLDQRQKDRWKANSMLLKANAHVWLKEKDAT